LYWKDNVLQDIYLNTRGKQDKRNNQAKRKVETHKDTRESPINYQIWAKHRRGGDPGLASSPQHEGGAEVG
jgi:hypothetical protein